MEYLSGIRHISRDIENVREIVLEELKRKLPESFVKSGYQDLLINGKMIRTAFLILLTKMAGGDPGSFYNVGASLEMFHIASLIHDDIMDRAKTRRASATVNSLLGDGASAVIGDMIMIDSLSRLIEMGEGEAAAILIKSGRLMIKGQFLEYRNSFNYDLKIEQYLRIIRLKTAELFSAAAKIIVCRLKLKSYEARNLRGFMVKTGMIFQIQDDLIDIRSGVSGKERFIDWREGKVTLPYILLRQANKGNLFDKREKIDGKLLDQMFGKYQIYGTVEKCIEKNLELCTEYLETFPKSSYRDDLVSLVNMLSRRDY